MKVLKFAFYANFAALGYGYINAYYYNNNKALIDKTKYGNQEFTQKFNEFQNNKENSKYFAKPIDRNLMIEELKSKQFDLLVIGGGSAGAGVLLDAYTRGLSVALIESNDFSSGTSSKSTKLAHGGIRYLEDAFRLKTNFKDAFNLLFEALSERDFFLNSAPFMNKRVEIKVPAQNWIELNYYYLGVFVYHSLYFASNFPNLFYTFSGPKLYITNDNKNIAAKYFAGWYEGQFWDARQNLLSVLTCRTTQFKGNE